MSITDKQKSSFLLVAFVGAIMTVVVLYFHFMIARGQVSDWKSRIASVDVELSTAKRDLAEIRGLMNQKDELEAQRSKIQKVVQRLPSTMDAPGFYMALASVLRQTGIVHDGVKVLPAEDRSLYVEIPYDIKANGRYHELGQFLTLIEQNPKRFMRVRSFTVSNNLDRPSMHPVELEIATFMFSN